jgi:shikimate dehydrogenase
MPRKTSRIPDARTRLYGVAGFPLAHTLSPLIHNSLFRHYRLNALYLVFEREPERFDADFIGALKAMRVRGFNVTLPHKTRVMDFLDRVDPLARKIGAVNTVVNRDGKLHGYNTDDHGFHKAVLEAFRGFRFKDSSILVLGAGGAAFGVAFTCLRNGCSRLVIANRTPSRAESLKRNLRKHFRTAAISLVALRKDCLSRLAEKPDLVVNATSYGLKGEKESLVGLKDCPEKTAVIDLIYNPPETAFLREARRRGLRTANGLSMLLFQGFEAFRIWTGITPDYARQKKRIFGRRNMSRSGRSPTA